MAKLLVTMFICLLLLLLRLPLSQSRIPIPPPGATVQKCIVQSRNTPNPNTNRSCIEKERQALLAFKSGLIDRADYLSSWRSEDKDCCRWVGIHCSLKTGHVTALDLNSGPEKICSLSGEIGPSLLNLSHLSYLDLSNNYFNGFPSPFIMSSLNSLRHLYLYCSFDREVILPTQLGNLSKLEYLEFGCQPSFFPSTGVRIESLESISRLSSLKYLQMSGQNLSTPSNLFHTIMNLSSLVNVNFLDCIIPTPPSFPSHFHHHLEVIQVIGGRFIDSPQAFFRWLNLNRKLVDLTVRRSSFGLLDSVLELIGSMTSLENLDLSSNELSGEIPVSWGNLCKLLTLDLYDNSFNGTLDVLIKNWSRCPHGHFLRELRVSNNELTGHLDFTKLPSYSHLQVLDFSRNKLNGSLSDDIWKLVNLRVLNISENAFQGFIPQTIGKLSNLTDLSARSNFLQGEISDNHISTLPRLRTLDLCQNSFKINLSLNFVPPFQLTTLRLCSLELGPKFPNWISTQKNLLQLDISDSGISGVAPSWLWDICESLEYFNISHNQVRGTSPNFPSGSYIDLRRNLFEGPLPHFSAMTSYLLLSENKFSGNINFLCAQEEFRYLNTLDLSNNMLSGVLPDCWTHYDLAILDLSNNDFHGTIPVSMTILPRLISLRLNNNRLVGKLSSSFGSINLVILDVADNQLSGNIPNWINRSFSNLIVLKLQLNRFSGEIPTGLCQLYNIQILDLSLNNLSGGIPTCFNNLVTMAQKTNKWSRTNIEFFVGIQDMPLVHKIIFSASVTWKGKKVTYQKLLALLKLIDISSNKLSGEIPAQLASLVGLISLNLSRNELTGPIPAMIGQLQELDVLDLSNNQISGRIPESISNIQRLTNLDLSNNNLSGEIPSTTQMLTFNATSFVGNPGLCGLQLEKKCHNDENSNTSNVINTEEDEDEDDDQWFKNPWFYGSVVVGFTIGFWGVCGPLVLYAPFRHTYFQFLDSVKDSLVGYCSLDGAKFKK